jgi:hypothetical protein
VVALLVTSSFIPFILGEGERRRRYAVCFNPLEAKRPKSHREELLKELEAELASLSDLAATISPYSPALMQLKPISGNYMARASCMSRPMGSSSMIGTSPH